MKGYKSEAQILENYDIALTNAINHPEIKVLIEEYGYDETLITEGKALYDNAKTAYNHNRKEDDETAAASLDFKNKRSAFDSAFKKDRKKAMLAFKRDEAALIKLGLTIAYPKTYPKWQERAEKFYNDLKDPGMLPKMARLKIDEAYIDSRITELEAVKEARKRYVTEDGESQQATKDKNKALEELDEWMDDFKDTAFIALEEKPQLLEVLGYFVRS